MKHKWIYDRVIHLTKKYQTRDPQKLIEALNIEIKLLPATHSLLGMYKVILKKRFIFLASNAGELQTTILAHELGHDQLHRKEVVEGMSFHESKVFSPLNRFEMEANIFACHLLIPDEDVISMLKQEEKEEYFIQKLRVDTNLFNLKISEMAKMGLLQENFLIPETPDASFLKRYKPTVSSPSSVIE